AGAQRLSCPASRPAKAAAPRELESRRASFPWPATRSKALHAKPLRALRAKPGALQLEPRALRTRHKALRRAMPATLPAREFRSEAEMRAFTDQVMELASAGNLKAALDLVSEAYTVVPKAELEAMTGQALLQAPMVEGRFGKSLDHEFVKE